MGDVNEELVRVYFEKRGFLVLTNKSYIIKKEKGTGYGDIDLLVFNPTTEERAIVQVKGWHTTTFTKNTFIKDEKKIFSSLLGEGAINCAHEFFGIGKFKKILIVPAFSTVEKTKIEAQEYLKSKGVEFITFSEIFEFLVRKIDTKRYHNDSEILYTIAKLKMYGFLKID